MEINSFQKCWAGPKGTAGPWPSPACAARAREGETAQPRRQPTAWLGLASRGKVPRRGARWRDGAARPAAGGQLRPWQRKPASAIGVRGHGESKQAATHGWEGEEEGAPRRPGTAAPWTPVARRGESLPRARKAAQARA